MNRAADDFFNLNQPFTEILNVDEFWKMAEDNNVTEIADTLFRPDVLESPEPPNKWQIKNKKIRNFSFTKTQLHLIEFTDCKFQNCLFIGSIITDCRFNNCEFVACNFYRSQFEKCYIDPKSFDRCLDRKSHANIGVGLYQELLHNSRMQAQPDFTRYAQYQFTKWKRHLGWFELVNSNEGCVKKSLKCIKLSLMWLFEKTTGSGVRLGNLAITSAIMLLAITLLNYFCQVAFGLKLGQEPVQGFAETFYFTTIVVTTLGFGDITPTTNIGRVIVALEVVVGFLNFALLVSMVFRRIAD